MIDFEDLLQTRDGPLPRYVPRRRKPRPGWQKRAKKPRRERVIELADGREVEIAPAPYKVIDPLSLSGAEIRALELSHGWKIKKPLDRESHPVVPSESETKPEK